jgi:hypothetical protein
MAWGRQQNACSQDSLMVSCKVSSDSLFGSSIALYKGPGSNVSLLWSKSKEKGVRVPCFLVEASPAAPRAVSALLRPFFFAVKDNSTVCSTSVTHIKISLGN